MTKQPTFQGKPCRKCGGTLRYTAHSKQCVACKVKARAAWGKKRRQAIKASPEKDLEDKQNKLAYWRKHKYGITPEQYSEMLAAQNSKCAICGKHDELNLAVDHCHETGQIRGLLCKYCNGGIGFLKDSIELLENAIKYLQKSR
jgi:hypothetical protein